MIPIYKTNKINKNLYCIVFIPFFLTDPSFIISENIPNFLTEYLLLITLKLLYYATFR